jgi:hypothetical protein
MKNLNLSHEEELLILCARLSLSEAEKARLAWLVQRETLVWQTLLESAASQRLGGFLFWHLHHPEFRDLVPAWVLAHLQRNYLQNGFKNQRLKSELGRVLRIMESEDIPVIALKGAALLETVYPNEFLRPMADNDLLVPEDLAEKAQTRVCELGYTVAVTAAEEAETRENCQHLPKIVDPRGLVFFEIHSHLFNRQSPFRCDLTSFKQHARHANIAGSDIKVLGPEHLLMHLAVHFFLDRRYRSGGALAQICDISETVRFYQSQIDWDFFAEELETNGLKGPVHYGLFLAQSILQAPVPPPFMERITPSKFSPDAANLFVRQRVFSNERVLASQWVAPGKAYNLPNILLGILGRVFSRGALQDKTNQPASPPMGKSPAWRYLCRLGDGVSLLTHYLRRPRQLWREIMTDRWIHSIMTQGGMARSGLTGAGTPTAGGPDQSSLDSSANSRPASASNLPNNVHGSR